MNAGTPIVIVESADNEDQAAEIMKKREEIQDVLDGVGTNHNEGKYFRLYLH